AAQSRQIRDEWFRHRRRLPRQTAPQTRARYGQRHRQGRRRPGRGVQDSVRARSYQEIRNTQCDWQEAQVAEVLIAMPRGARATQVGMVITSLIAATLGVLSFIRTATSTPSSGCCARRRSAWTSSARQPREGMPALDPSPVARPDCWLQHVNEPQTEAEVERLRLSVPRGRPYGEALWMKETARRLGD